MGKTSGHKTIHCSLKNGLVLKNHTPSCPQEYVDVVCPLLVLASQKYEEILLKKHQRVRTSLN